MPYLTNGRKVALGPEGYMDPETPGDLNYLITSLCHHYFLRYGRNYRAINDVLGALEGAKLEFYRRVAAPYEDKKMKENGDVYV